MENYGKELIIDLHKCNPCRFNRVDIEKYCEELCELIKMEACTLHFWDDEGVAEEERQTDPKTKGTSAVQFIITSNITIHTLDDLGKVFINIFSCKDFDSSAATMFTHSFFGGMVYQHFTIVRF